MDDPTKDGGDTRNVCPRPIIMVGNALLDGLRGQALRAIAGAVDDDPRNPLVVAQGTALRRPEWAGGTLRLVECSPERVRHILSDVAQWQQSTQSGARWVFPPLDLAKDLLIPPWDGVPVCDVVFHHPVLVDGVLRSTPGYDADARVWIVGDEIDVPKDITYSDIQDAVAVLDELFVDFPFVTASDKANLYSMLFTAIMRRDIKGSVPMFIAEAPTRGSGKSLLLEVCALILMHSDDVRMTSMPVTEEERKKVLPLLASQKEIVILDNVDGKLDSDILDMMLTAPSVEYRILGVSGLFYFPMQAIMAMSGNQIQLSESLYRRVLFIQIDPQMEEPSLRRGFQIPNIRGWVRENRGVVLRALLTIVQGWVERGAKRSDHIMGSYEEWAAQVGGVLTMIGLGDAFLGNRDALRVDKGGDQFVVREFVEAWADKYGTKPTGVRQLFYLAAGAPPVPPGITISGEQMRERESYQGLLGDLLAGFGEASQRKSFGQLLKRFQSRVFGQWKIVKHGRSNGETQYRLVVVEGVRGMAHDHGNDNNTTD